LIYSIHTLSHGHFTNMAALLLILAVLVFLMGLIAEQLAAIHMQGRR
ncbi:MAG: glycosyltransferase family 2 protein, partial [Zetaproteobacteria bacterium]